MKRPSKKDLANAVQFFLFAYSMTAGFVSTYFWVWVMVGLQLNLLSIAVLTVLGVLSAIGLFEWIRRN